ncbi:hypothetical protein [Actinomadura sp. NPDC048394]|uniref:hypothetical protein n=1 Tax=Actinomadura sp. NPDC048394 TaxID=3158223 RepID=UPI0033DDD812
MEPSLTPHPPGDLTFDDDGKGPQECWDLLGERVRGKLAGTCGTTIYRCAKEEAEGRVSGAVLGEKAFAYTAPGHVFHRRLRITWIHVFEFVPGSLRATEVEHRPDAGAPPPPAPPGTEPPHLDLDDAARSVLGNLPPQVQDFLQRPFLHGRSPLFTYWYYLGSERELAEFLFCMADENDLTAATGTMVVPPGHAGPSAHWSLTCRYASVKRRILL